MSRRPEYLRDGFRPAGPGGCRCPHCGATVTTNALGRASHLRACPALKAQRERVAQRKSLQTMRYEEDDR